MLSGDLYRDQTGNCEHDTCDTLEPAAKPQSQKDNGPAQFQSLSDEQRVDDLALDGRKSEVSARDGQNNQGRR